MGCVHTLLWARIDGLAISRLLCDERGVQFDWLISPLAKCDSPMTTKCLRDALANQLTDDNQEHVTRI
jgi:hypothetical protein